MATYFVFDRPELLWLLISIPLLLFTHLYFMHHARKKAILFGNFKTIERVTGTKIITKNILLLIFRMIIFAALIFAIAGTTMWTTGDRAKNDLVIAIDTSASMSTQDMGGTRFDAAKNAAHDFIASLDSSMRISVVQYSGLATIVVEPTTDKDVVLRGIDAMKLQPIGGTDIASAIVTSTNLLIASPTTDTGRVVVLLSDGVASNSLYDDNPVPQAIDYARKHTVTIHTIGIGTQHSVGAFIPELDASAATFDQQNLQLIANSTGGYYAWGLDQEQLRGAFARVSANRTRAQIPTSFTGTLLLIALGGLFLEWGLINTRYRLLP